MWETHIVSGNTCQKHVFASASTMRRLDPCQRHVLASAIVPLLDLMWIDEWRHRQVPPLTLISNSKSERSFFGAAAAATLTAHAAAMAMETAAAMATVAATVTATVTATVAVMVTATAAASVAATGMGTAASTMTDYQQ